jgi:glutathione S-transferase
MVRIVLTEKGLEDRFAILEAQTRQAESPYYAVNPSGRVPYLERSEGPGLEDSRLIIEYLDGLRPPAQFAGDFEVRRLESVARSMLDGVAVWARESRRPEAEQSPTIVAHERARAARLADFWDGEAAHPLMQEGFNLAQLTLIVTLQLEGRFGFEWREGHSQLAAWVDRLAKRPSIAANP